MPCRPSLKQLHHEGCGGIRVRCRRFICSILPMLICLRSAQRTHQLSLSAAAGARLARPSVRRSSRVSLCRCVLFVRVRSGFDRARRYRWIRSKWFWTRSRRTTRGRFALTTLMDASSSMARSSHLSKTSKHPQSAGATIQRSSSLILPPLLVACISMLWAYVAMLLSLCASPALVPRLYPTSLSLSFYCSNYSAFQPHYIRSYTSCLTQMSCSARCTHLSRSFQVALPSSPSSSFALPHRFHVHLANLPQQNVIMFILCILLVVRVGRQAFTLAKSQMILSISSSDSGSDSQLIKHYESVSHSERASRRAVVQLNVVRSITDRIILEASMRKTTM